jgi:hypothetical protein
MSIPGIPNGAKTFPDRYRDFGSQNISSGKIFTYTIENFGAGVLTLSGTPRVAISGTHAADFVVKTQPPATVAKLTTISLPGFSGNNPGRETFEITFTPSAVGIRTATVSIANNDPADNPYTFDIQGTGVACTNPSVFTVSGGGDYCDGGTGVTIRLNGSQSGVSYQLKLNGNVDGAPVEGKGISFVRTAAGTYTVVATTTEGGCR